jgi:putative PEP-CTERM system histidine kinase
VALLSALPFTAAAASLVLAVANLFRKQPTVVGWLFFAGMVAFGLDSLFMGLALRGVQIDGVVFWLTLAYVMKASTPALWLAFSLTYSRGGARQALRRWCIPLGVFGLLTIGFAVGYRDRLFQLALVEGGAGAWRLEFGTAANVLNVIFLVSLVLILMNLEQTFRAAVGTMRWRIKFVIVALVVLFGSRLYVKSQVVLFSAPDIELWAMESGGLLLGCGFLLLAYLRTGGPEIDVYPSTAVLRSSVTVVIAGSYLFVVGVVAKVAGTVGGAERFHIQSLVLLLGMAGLTVLLLSDRLRQAVRLFVARHFQRARHDATAVWSRFSHRLATVKDQEELCAASARLISEIFEVLSVSVWLKDEQRDRFALVVSTTGQPPGGGMGRRPVVASSAIAAGLRGRPVLFDLDSVAEPWAEELRRLNPMAFSRGGHRWCAPLLSGDGILGALVLGDRVNGALYSVDELELLRCIGDQITSVLLNLRLANEVAQARELEAFRTMSAFFVHDLKNAAASLNLMLKNLPVHFDNPEFRADALRGIGNVAWRIDDIIARLSTLRQRPDVRRTETDLNQLVTHAIENLDALHDIEMVKELGPLPPVWVDGDQIRSVVTNLVLNARDAAGERGRIVVRTEHRDGGVTLSVSDNGCGMSDAFVRESLFRPFQSTKKNGLGIGMFQSRAIVEAHGGSIEVESEAGRGTTLRVSLPAGVGQ